MWLRRKKDYVFFVFSVIVGSNENQLFPSTIKIYVSNSKNHHKVDHY